MTPDLEEITGLVHDLCHVLELLDLMVLRSRFKDEPLYLDVLDMIVGLSLRDATVHKKKQAQHRESQYMLEEVKPWFIGGGSGVWARSRQECISRAEAVELARAEHEQGGHWHCDTIKMALLD